MVIDKGKPRTSKVQLYIYPPTYKVLDKRNRGSDSTSIDDANFWLKETFLHAAGLFLSRKTSLQPSDSSENTPPVFQHIHLFVRHGSKSLSKRYPLLTISDISFFFTSHNQVNPSQIGLTSRANSKGGSLNSETTSPRNREQNFPRRKADIIFTSHMHALGVCTVSFMSCDLLHMLNQYLAHRTLIVRILKGLEDIIPYTSVHWEMLEKGSCYPTRSVAKFGL